MKIKVIGKEHMEGVSKKSGNSYNFIVVYFISDCQEGRGVGKKGDSLMLDPTFFNFHSIAINQEYEVTYGRYGKVEGFLPAK